MSKLPRLYRLTRIIRLLRMVKFFKFSKLKIVQSVAFSKFFTENVKRLIKTMLFCLVFVHLSACFFFLIVRQEPLIVLKNFLQAKLSDSSKETWIFEQGIQDEDPGIQYLYSFYWSMQTVTTVGFGDIYPISIQEKIYVMVWMAFGGAYYSFVISNLGQV